MTDDRTPGTDDGADGSATDEGVPDGEGSGDSDGNGGEDGETDVGTVGAIDGAVLLLAAGKASVAPERLPDLVERAADRLRDRRETYRRTCERVHADADREIFFVDRDHWATLGDELGFDERETDAVRRAHEEQLRHVGRRAGRETEFDHALEIRRAVAVGWPDDESEGGSETGDGNEDGTPEA